MLRPRKWLQFSLQALLLFLLAIAVACGWWVEYRRRAHLREVNSQIEKVNAAEKIGELFTLYRGLYELVGTDDLGFLQRSTDDSIALQAAWENIKRSVTTPPTLYRNNKVELAGFLDMVKTRAGATVPRWWAEAVLDAGGNRIENRYLDQPNIWNTSYYKGKLTLPDVPEDPVVEAIDGAMTLRVESNILVVPDELRAVYDPKTSWCGHDRIEDPLEQFNATFRDDSCFIAIHSNGGSPHVVARVNRESNQVVWKAETCSGLYSYSEKFVGWISVVVEKDRVVVFGNSSTGFYAHGFDIETGKRLFRFSSDF